MLRRTAPVWQYAVCYVAVLLRMLRIRHSSQSLTIFTPPSLDCQRSASPTRSTCSCTQSFCGVYLGVRHVLNVQNPAHVSQVYPGAVLILHDRPQEGTQTVQVRVANVQTRQVFPLCCLLTQHLPLGGR